MLSNFDDGNDDFGLDADNPEDEDGSEDDGDDEYDDEGAGVDALPARPSRLQARKFFARSSVLKNNIKVMPAAVFIPTITTESGSFAFQLPDDLPALDTKHLHQAYVDRSRCLSHAIFSENFHQQARSRVYGHYRTVASELLPWFDIGYDATPSKNDLNEPTDNALFGECTSLVS